MGEGGGGGRVAHSGMSSGENFRLTVTCLKKNRFFFLAAKRLRNVLAAFVVCLVCDYCFRSLKTAVRDGQDLHLPPTPPPLIINPSIIPSTRL